MSAGDGAAAREAEMRALLEKLTLEIAALNAALALASLELRRLADAQKEKKR